MFSRYVGSDVLSKKSRNSRNSTSKPPPTNGSSRPAENTAPSTLDIDRPLATPQEHPKAYPSTSEGTHDRPLSRPPPPHNGPLSSPLPAMDAAYNHRLRTKPPHRTSAGFYTFDAAYNQSVPTRPAEYPTRPPPDDQERSPRTFSTMDGGAYNRPPPHNRTFISMDDGAYNQPPPHSATLTTDNTYNYFLSTLSPHDTLNPTYNPWASPNPDPSFSSVDASYGWTNGNVRPIYDWTNGNVRPIYDWTNGNVRPIYIHSPGYLYPRNDFPSLDAAYERANGYARPPPDPRYAYPPQGFSTTASVYDRPLDPGYARWPDAAFATTDSIYDRSNNTAHSTLDPAYTRETARSTLDPAYSREAARSTLDPANDREAGRSTLDPANTREAALSTLDPANTREAARSTLDPANTREAARSTTDSAYDRSNNTTRSTLDPSYNRPPKSEAPFYSSYDHPRLTTEPAYDRPNNTTRSTIDSGYARPPKDFFTTHDHSNNASRSAQDPTYSQPTTNASHSALDPAYSRSVRKSDTTFTDSASDGPNTNIPPRSTLDPEYTRPPRSDPVFITTEYVYDRSLTSDPPRQTDPYARPTYPTLNSDITSTEYTPPDAARAVVENARAMGEPVYARTFQDPARALTEAEYGRQSARAPPPREREAGMVNEDGEYGRPREAGRTNGDGEYGRPREVHRAIMDIDYARPRVASKSTTDLDNNPARKASRSSTDLDHHRSLHASLSTTDLDYSRPDDTKRSSADIDYNRPRGTKNSITNPDYNLLRDILPSLMNIDSDKTSRQPINTTDRTRDIQGYSSPKSPSLTHDIEASPISLSPPQTPSYTLTDPGYTRPPPNIPPPRNSSLASANQGHSRPISSLPPRLASASQGHSRPISSPPPLRNASLASPPSTASHQPSAEPTRNRPFSSPTPPRKSSLPAKDPLHISPTSPVQQFKEVLLDGPYNRSGSRARTQSTLRLDAPQDRPLSAASTVASVIASTSSRIGSQGSGYNARPRKSKSMPTQLNEDDDALRPKRVFSMYDFELEVNLSRLDTTFQVNRLVWFPYELFREQRMIAKSSFAIVYLARVWRPDGTGFWDHRGHGVVVLKEIDETLMNEVGYFILFIYEGCVDVFFFWTTSFVRLFRRHA
ncbi:hypothetical protein BC938DRAFT_479713 [Jimgerdemannia flammicorona]|uniref:Uncharacterized protein n=1 Tax=Jimgerdemannia flammicorona TaxID=994334 RepID=A0A433QKA5_9FUNG|nr:hypothetical protein BC938DRAFT_479713 [Jimgerdemannia flammicorona]